MKSYTITYIRFVIENPLKILLKMMSLVHRNSHDMDMAEGEVIAYYEAEGEVKVHHKAEVTVHHEEEDKVQDVNKLEAEESIM